MPVSGVPDFRVCPAAADALQELERHAVVVRGAVCAAPQIFVDVVPAVKREVRRTKSFFETELGVARVIDDEIFVAIEIARGFVQRVDSALFRAQIRFGNGVVDAVEFVVVPHVAVRREVGGGHFASAERATRFDCRHEIARRDLRGNHDAETVTCVGEVVRLVPRGERKRSGVARFSAPLRLDEFVERDGVVVDARPRAGRFPFERHEHVVAISFSLFQPIFEGCAMSVGAARGSDGFRFVGDVPREVRVTEARARLHHARVVEKIVHVGELIGATRVDADVDVARVAGQRFFGVVGARRALVVRGAAGRDADGGRRDNDEEGTTRNGEHHERYSATYVPRSTTRGWREIRLFCRRMVNHAS